MEDTACVSTKWRHLSVWYYTTHRLVNSEENGNFSETKSLVYYIPYYLTAFEYIIQPDIYNAVMSLVKPGDKYIHNDKYWFVFTSRSV